MESEDDGYMQVEDRGKEGDLRLSNVAAAGKLTRTFYFICHFLKES